MSKILSILAILTLTVSCIKTADQVNREKRIDSMTEQVKDSQGLMADMVSQMKEMQSQINQLSGKIEEIEHKQRQVDPQSITKMNETLEHVKTKQESESGQLNQIQNELKEQRIFMEKVTASLTSMKAAPKAQKKSPKEELAEGLELIKKDKYVDARRVLETLIDHSSLTAGDHNKVLHGLGKVEYYTNNSDKALVYMSKVYTKYPKSSLAPSCLFFIGRSLEKLGKSEEAKQAFAKVVEEYPGTKEAKDAQKEL